MNGLRAIKYHPADTESETVEHNPKLKKNNVWTVLIFAAILGCALGIASKLILVSGRYYQAEGVVEITGVKGAERYDALRRNLAGLMTFSRKIRNTVTVNELMKQGKLNIFVSKDKDITLKLIGEDKSNLRNITEFILAEYIADFSARQKLAKSQLSAQQANSAKEYQTLREKYASLNSRLSKATNSLTNNQLDQAIVAICATMKSKIDKSAGIVNSLSNINSELTQARGELLNPIVRIDPERLARAEKNDRSYTGDYNLLKLRHQTYLYYLKKEMSGLRDGLTKLRSHLQSISRHVGKHLTGSVPADLADDILELNLAAELYDGKISRFENKCNRYWDKILQMLSDPEKADFAGTATLLSQLRQDLFTRCGDLPKQLRGLYEKLYRGRGKSAKRRSILSGTVARNIVSSAVVHDLDESLQMWNKIVFHLNRHFADGNVRLKTIGRMCRAMQSRIKLRKRKIIQKIERKQLAEKKRKLRKKISQLQIAFEQKSKTLIAAYKGLRTDQQKLAKIGKSWPEWQNLTKSINDTKYQLARIEKTQNMSKTLPISLWRESLHPGPVIVTAENSFNIPAKWESSLSLLIGLAATGLTLLAKVVFDKIQRA